MTDRKPTAIETLREKFRTFLEDYSGNAVSGRDVDAVIAALDLTWDRLAWAANNPETLAALASGEISDAMCRAGILASPMWLVDTNVRTGDKRVVPSRAHVSLDTAEVAAIFRAMLAALPDPNPTDNPPMAMTEGRT